VAGAFVHKRAKIAIISAAFIAVIAASGFFFVAGLSTNGSSLSPKTLALPSSPTANTPVGARGAERPAITSDPRIAVERGVTGNQNPSRPFYMSPRDSGQQGGLAAPKQIFQPFQVKPPVPPQGAQTGGSELAERERALQELLVARERVLQQELLASRKKISSIQEIAAREIALKRKAGKDASCREKYRSRGVYFTDSDPCIDLDDLIKNLASGVYRFNKPTSAYVEEPFRVVLTLPTAEGQDVLSVFRGTEGKIVDRSAPIAQHLEATLRGGLDFKVDPYDAQQRTVTSSSPVVWEWTVVPMRPGKKMIVIEVAANLIMGKQKEHVQLRTLYEEIQINVGFLHWFQSTFSGLWGTALGLATMIIAILGVFHYLPSRQKGRHHKRSDEPPPVELVTHQQIHPESSPPHQ
jgi:hypothetical protein